MIEQKERKIYIKELLWDILVNWKLVIVLALIFALLLGALSFLRSDSSAAGQKGSYDKSDYTEHELYNIDKAIANYTRLAYYEEYNSKSELVNVNMAELKMVSLQYYIKSAYTYNYTNSNENDYTPSLVAIYQNYFSKGEFANDVMNGANISMELEYFNELLTADVVRDTYTISVDMIIPAKYDADVIREVMKKAIDKKASTLQNIGEHSLVVVNDTINKTVDEELAQQNFTFKHELANFHNYYNETINAMSEKERQFFVYLLKNEYDFTGEQIKMATKDFPESYDDEENANAKKVNLKYVILGAFLGLFLAAVYVIVKGILSSRLQCSEDMNNVYDLRVLGNIDWKISKGRTDGITKFLLKGKYGNMARLSYEEQVSIIVNNIKLACKAKDTSKIALVTGVPKDLNDALINDVIASLKEQGIEAVMAGRIVYDKVEFDKVLELGTVAVLEKIGISRYDDIAAQLELLKCNKVDVTGAIVVR